MPITPIIVFVHLVHFRWRILMSSGEHFRQIAVIQSCIGSIALSRCAMKSIRIWVLAAAFLAGFSMSVVDAAPGRGGRGGGGGAHFSGGGAHFGGGGARFGGGGRAFGGGRSFGAGPRFGGGRAIGGPRFGGSHFSGRHFGGPRAGSGQRFGGRPAFSRSAGRSHMRTNRSFAGQRNVNRVNRGASRRAMRNSSRTATNAQSRIGTNTAASRARVSRTMQSRAVAGALRNRTGLRNPNMRAAITASAAMGAWQHRHGDHRHGWWRHRHGGYGWVGPLFWPFAYYDFYDYTMWGYGYDDPFWDYGYGDVYAGLFAPYGYDALSGYFPEEGTSRGGRTVGRVSSASPAGNPSKNAPSQLTQMCGEDSRNIAGLPIDRIQDALQPNDEQRAALDDLANASVKAAQDLKTACPTDVALTAPGRMAAMEKRIEAMIAAVDTVRPPLDKFYGLLTDEQKARWNALGQQQRKGKDDKSAAQTDTGGKACGGSDAGVTQWPTAEIERRLQPTEAQRDSLKALQDATAKAADMLLASCQREGNLTPPARLAAVEKRLNTLLDAVKTVHTALNGFYGTLSDEQKAQFEAIGPQQMGALEPDETASSSQHASSRPHRHRHGVRSVEGVLRHFIAIVR